MIVSQRLRSLREEKKLSQGDIEKRSGLLRCYISRVENGHTVPAIETLEKMARALEVPLYLLFCDGDEVPAPPAKLKMRSKVGVAEEHDLPQFYQCLSRMEEDDRRLLLFMARRMALKKTAKKD